MQINIEELVRPEVAKIKPYKGEKETREYSLDLAGNESPYDLPLDIKKEITDKIMENPLNYYPKLYSKSLRCSIAQYLDIDLDCDQVMVGNGSDDVLDLMIDTFVNSGDRVLAAAPTFSMYRFFTEIVGGRYENFSLADMDFTLENIKKIIDDFEPKMIFLCSPNNPTGQQLSKDVILQLADIYSGILVIDEAYAEFAEESLLSHVNQHTNLAVTRTFSKAFGLAGIRLGYLVGSKELVKQVGKVLKPYNINSITSLIGKIILREEQLIENRVEKIKLEREKMLKIYSEYDNWNVFDSSANFVYIEGEDTMKFKEMLNKMGIKIRSFDRIPPAIRITIGKPEENKKVAKIFKEFKEVSKNE
ncbi:MAG: histidinol-phosphate transaminase [Halanaerobiales bacterium]